MSRRLTRRGVLEAIAAGSVLVTAGQPATSAPVQTVPSGQFRQQVFDAENTGATPYDGPTQWLGATWNQTVESVNSAPLVVDDLVVVLSLVGRESRVYGLELETGRERWQVDLDDVAVSGMLAAGDDHVVTAGIVEPRVLGISLDDGTIDWETTVDDLPGGFRSGPRVADGSLYLQDRTERRLHRFDARTGESHQSYPGPFTRFAVGDDRIYGSLGKPRQDPTGVAIIDPDTPEDRFVAETPGRPGRPSVGDETVYVGTSANTVHAIETATGADRWSVAVDDWAVSLTLTDDLVLALTNESLTALDRDTGEDRWRIDSGASRAVVARDDIYLGREGGVDVYDLDSGVERTSYRDEAIAGNVNYLSVVDDALFAASVPGTIQLVQEQIFHL